MDFDVGWEANECGRKRDEVAYGAGSFIRIQPTVPTAIAMRGECKIWPVMDFQS